MRRGLKLSYRPYLPLDRCEDVYIVRIAPEREGVQAEWLSVVKGAYTVSVKDAAGNCVYCVETPENVIQVSGLHENEEYSLIVRAGGQSACRLFRTGDYRGTVVNYLHPKDVQYDFSGRYLCSPSIARYKGDLYVSMDVYRMHGPQNLSLLFRSKDEGATWEYVTDLFPCFWGSLFVADGRLCILATDTEYGDLFVSATENGTDWAPPTVLLRGAGNYAYSGVHKAPVPVCHNGRYMYCAVEWGSWEQKRFASITVSYDTERDVLDYGAWKCSAPLPYDMAWGAGNSCCGGIEGNMVEYGGRIYNFLRFEGNRALMLAVDAKHRERAPRFESVIDFAPAHSKFCIRKAENGVYYAAGNPVTCERNVLSLFRSENLRIWQKTTDLIDASDKPAADVGFQYPDFILERDTALFAVRTAVNGAANFHDTNCIVFLKKQV